MDGWDGTDLPVSATDGQQDEFVFDGAAFGQDTIQNLEIGVDLLVFRNVAGITDEASFMANLTNVGGDKVLTDDNGNTITFDGLAAGDFT